MASSSQVTGNGWEEWPDKGGPTSLSDHTNVTTTKPSTPGKTPIDSLSREELIKHIKKQTILLQKMKGRTEELSKECNKLKEELCKQPEVAPSNNEHLIEEVQILKSERDQSLNEAKQVKLLMLSIEQDHKERTINLEENISTLKYDNSALKEKISQLEVSMATRNDEMNKLNDVIERLTEKNKSMEVEMSSLVKGRDEMEDERRRMKDELERLTIEIDNKASTWSSEKDELMSRARSDLEEQKDNLIIARNDYESLREQKENEIELLKEEKEREAKLLKDKLEELQRELLVNEGVRKEHDKTVESLKKQLDEAQREKENEIHRLSEELMTNKDESDRMKNEMEQIMKSKNEREEHGEGTMVRINDLQLEKEQLVKEMETQSHQHKEEMKKLKAIAVKLKKELSEMKEKEQDGNNLVQQINDKDSAIEELKVSLKDVEENFNNTKKELEQEKSVTHQLQSTIEALKGQLDKSKGDIGDMRREKDEAIQRLEDDHTSSKNQLQTIEIELLSTQNQLESVKKESINNQSEIEKLQGLVLKERTEHEETRKKLAALDKEVKSSSLMSLELADYQRSLETLRGQVKDGDVAKTELECKLSSKIKELDELKKEYENYKEDASQKDEMMGKMKILLRKTTKDLSDVKGQCTEHLQSIEELKKELETEKEISEMAKIEISQLTAQIQSNSEQHVSSQSHYQSLIHSLEGKLTSSQSDLTSSMQLLQQTQQEFDSYKTRVHSVLKQKQTTPSVNEIEANLRQKFDIELITVKSELKDTQDRLAGVLSEYEELEGTHQELVRNHSDSLHSNQHESAKLKEKLLEVTEAHRVKVADLESEISRLKCEKDENIMAFKAQIHSMQNEYQSNVNSLTSQLQQAHSEISRLQQSHQSDVSRGQSLVAMTTLVETKNAKNENKPINDNISEVHGDIKGLTELTTPTHQEPSNNDKMSLEQLLSVSTSELTMNTTSKMEGGGANDDSITHDQLVSSIKKINHLTDLLHESEANSIRLSDQTKLLKEEIRRLERNQERQKEASANMEYLKNVILKFLHSNNEERGGLVPIMCRLLQLSQQEKVFLQETVRGRRPDIPDDVSGGNHQAAGQGSVKGLANYLHRWTGY